MICDECGEDKKHQAKGLCAKCYQRMRYQKWRDANPRYETKTCEMLKQHHDDMKDDPESLSTEFIQNLIGVECK